MTMPYTPPAQETRRQAKARLGQPSLNTEPVFNPVELSASALPINSRTSGTGRDLLESEGSEADDLIGTQVTVFQAAC